MGSRLTVGRLTLDQVVGVRIPAPQPGHALPNELVPARSQPSWFCAFGPSAHRCVVPSLAPWKSRTDSLRRSATHLPRVVRDNIQDELCISIRDWSWRVASQRIDQHRRARRYRPRVASMSRGRINITSIAQVQFARLPQSARFSCSSRSGRCWPMSRSQRRRPSMRGTSCVVQRR